MIVPEYWAEARLQKRLPDRQITIRRFGWADTSAEDAQANAQRRAEEAMARVLEGANLPRREPKTPYNGADGVPIREEIISRHGDAVVTRNGYGALCLNTPDVLFADIDFQREPACALTVALAIAGLAVAALAGMEWHSWRVALVTALAGLAFSPGLAKGFLWLQTTAAGGPERLARRRIDRWIRKHPDWHLRLYRTPAGFRLLAMHQIFDAREPAVLQCFKDLGVDPVYLRMCHHQRCFRARVTAKPWRIGIGTHLRPRPGIWPVAPERLPLRMAWVERYQEKAAAYAACEFVASLGSQTVHPRAEATRQVHDEFARAHSGLKIA